MFYCYILESEKNGSYYIGSCDDVALRLNQHNRGLVKSTKRYIPWKVVYTQEFDTLKKARARERQIKSWKKRLAIKRLIDSKIY